MCHLRAIRTATREVDLVALLRTGAPSLMRLLGSCQV